MRTLAAAVCLVLMGWFPAAGQETEFTSGDKSVDSVVAEGNVLALQLYALLKDEKENIVFSPYALSASMGIAFGGAEWSTQSQIARIFRFRLMPAALAKAYLWQNERYETDSPFYCNLGLWIQKGPIKKPFQDLVEKDFRAVLRQVDFVNRFDSVRLDINNWMREKTQGKVANMVSRMELSNDARMVLVSGAYVKGRWIQTFDPLNTKQAPFFRDRYVTSTVSTMFLTADFNYLREAAFDLVELPYEQRKEGKAKASLFILLPHETYGLKTVEGEITADKLAKWINRMEKRRIALNLPQFRITEGYSLADVYKKMGLVDAFNENADFSDIREGNDLWLSRVLHKATYSVHEWGSEGGLAGGGSGDMYAESKIPVSMKVDHPFMFFVLDRETGAILMLGRVLSP